VLAPGVLAALPILVDQEPTVGAHVDGLGGGGQELGGAPACEGDLVELRLRARREEPALGRVQPRRAVDDALAVGGEGVGVLIRAVHRQPPRLAPLRRHDVDVEVSVPVAGEGDVPAVPAPDRHEVVGRVGGQLRGHAPGRRDAVEVAPVREDDRRAIGGDGGVAQPERFLLGCRGRGAAERGDEQRDPDHETDPRC